MNWGSSKPAGGQELPVAEQHTHVREHHRRSDPPGEAPTFWKRLAAITAAVNNAHATPHASERSEAPSSSQAPTPAQYKAPCSDVSVSPTRYAATMQRHSRVLSSSRSLPTEPAAAAPAAPRSLSPRRLMRRSNNPRVPSADVSKSRPSSHGESESQQKSTDGNFEDNEEMSALIQVLPEYSERPWCLRRRAAANEAVKELLALRADIAEMYVQAAQAEARPRSFAGHKQCCALQPRAKICSGRALATRAVMVLKPNKRCVGSKQGRHRFTGFQG